MAQSWNWTPQSKLCFVTTGATAPFTALIESVLCPSSLDTLHSLGYTHLLIQYGSAKHIYDAHLATAREYIQQAGQVKQLVIDGIDFDLQGLHAQFKLVRQSKGVVLSHAGTLSSTYQSPNLLT